MYNFTELECVNNFAYDRIADLIIKNGTKLKIAADKIVYNFNDDANGLYYIESGKIRGFYLNEDGDKENVIVFSNNILFGEDLFANPRKRVLGADTVTQCIVYYIDRERLLDLCMKDRKAMSQLLGLFTKKWLFSSMLLMLRNKIPQRKSSLFIFFI